ncbi:MAG: helix-hairpin-helix domain-containing protein, partial [Pseudomonadota bacterium]
TEGAIKADYRRFNIKEATDGDDYLAMEEAVRRRYTRVRKGESPVPDLVLIDGGKGQLQRAVKVLEELDLTEIALVGVAKGRSRRPGAEQLVFPGESRTLSLPPDASALLLIQNIRDEAHRFAITGHRGRRQKARLSSPLEEIYGLGPKRRRALLREFGGLQGVQSAGVEDLARTAGISRQMAQTIYNRFHGSEPGAGLSRAKQEQDDDL